MKKTGKFLTFALLCFLAASCEKEISVTVTTNPATEVGMKTAVISGKVTSSAEVSEVYFYYSNQNLVKTELASDGSFQVSLEGLTPNTQYYYKAGAFVDGRPYDGQILDFTTERFSGQAVDLGLSVLWADLNVGATDVYEYGELYAWGEVDKKTTYNWSTYRHGSAPTSLTKYIVDASRGTVDNLTVLQDEDDAAACNWAKGWRMPTYDELNELATSCTFEFTTVEGINGAIVTGPNGNTIFLPAAGYGSSGYKSRGSYYEYWASSLPVKQGDCAYYMTRSGSKFKLATTSRVYGSSIRPVKDK